MKKIIFTDLDGSLLDSETYSYKEAEPALELIRKEKIPLVLCSSKTRAEIERYRARLHNRDPFIVENGAAIFAPAGYFTFHSGGMITQQYIVSSFGIGYAEIRREFNRLRERTSVPVKGFGDMTAEQISRCTGLPLEEASLAQQREYGEPFVFEGEPDPLFLGSIEAAGLRWTQGRFYFLSGNYDKGGAVRLLKRWYESEHGKTLTIGIGDGFNDLSLLKAVDYPVLVRKPDGRYDPRIELPGLTMANGIGPAGWNQSVLELLKQ